MVMDFVWLQVGIEEIDDQHRELFATITRLIESLTQNHGDDKIQAVFDFLENYTTQHFGLEERLMREHEYADAPEHLAAHAVFVSSFHAIRDRFRENGDATMASLDACNQLGDWLVSHIADMDRRLGAFLTGPN